MSKKSHFRGCFDKENGKRAQTRFKSASRHLYHIHQSLPSQFSWKKAFLLTCQILGLLVNTLAADEEYPLPNRDNSKIPTQMQLSEEQKTFSQCFAAFLKCRLHFELFETKGYPQIFCISEIAYSENGVM